jgi:hypothetical protein
MSESMMEESLMRSGVSAATVNHDEPQDLDG